MGGFEAFREAGVWGEPCVEALLGVVGTPEGCPHAGYTRGERRRRESKERDENEKLEAGAHEPAGRVLLHGVWAGAA